MSFYDEKPPEPHIGAETLQAEIKSIASTTHFIIVAEGSYLELFLDEILMANIDRHNNRMEIPAAAITRAREIL